MSSRRSRHACRPSVKQLVFVHPSDELYGADRMVLEMVRAVPNGTPVEVWVPQDLPHPPADLALCNTLARRGVTVRHLDLPIMRRAYRNPRGLATLFRNAFRTLKALRAVRTSALYCTTSAAFLAAPLARLAGLPSITGHLQEIWSPTDAKVLHLPARACHRLISISQAVTSALPPSLQRRTTVVPNGTPGPSQVLALAGRQDDLRFLVASRWNGWKGHRTLLAAWDRAGAPGHLVILGGPPSSGDTVDVRALVGRLRRPEAVSVIGEVNDPSSYLDEADVVLVPSEQAEPFGLVAIEAFAHGRPVLASAAGGLLEIVSHDRDGWLFPPGDVDALATILAGLSREAVTSAGRQARDTYESRFTADRFARAWRAAVLTSSGLSDLDPARQTTGRPSIPLLDDP